MAPGLAPCYLRRRGGQAMSSRLLWTVAALLLIVALIGYIVR
ncbi:MAG: hypothetical protein ACFBQW_01655 [Sphingomonadaceae bacterium]